MLTVAKMPDSEIALVGTKPEASQTVFDGIAQHYPNCLKTQPD